MEKNNYFAKLARTIKTKYKSDFVYLMLERGVYSVVCEKIESMHGIRTETHCIQAMETIDPKFKEAMNIAKNKHKERVLLESSDKNLRFNNQGKPFEKWFN